MAVVAALAPGARTLTTLEGVFDGKPHLRTWQLGTPRRHDTSGPKPRSTISDIGYAGIGSGVYRPDGAQFAAEDRLGDIVLYDARTGEKRHELPGRGSEAELEALVYGTDGRSLAVDYGSQVEIWDTHERKKERVLKNVDGYSLALGGDGDKRVLVTSAGDRVDVSTGEVSRDALGSLEDAEFSPDGSVLAVSRDEGVSLWNGAATTRIGAMGGEPGDRSTTRSEAAITELRFSADGKSLAAVVGREDYRIWDVPSRRSVGGVQPGVEDRLNGLAFDREGRLHLTGTRVRHHIVETDPDRMIRTICERVDRAPDLTRGNGIRTCDRHRTAGCATHRDVRSRGSRRWSSYAVRVLPPPQGPFIPPGWPGAPDERRTDPAEPKLHADKGYGYDHLCRWLRDRGIPHRTARRGVESSQRSFRHRGVVEPTVSWPAGCPRPHRRYEREAEPFLAFLAFVGIRRSPCRLPRRLTEWSDVLPGRVHVHELVVALDEAVRAEDDELRADGGDITTAGRHHVPGDAHRVVVHLVVVDREGESLLDEVLVRLMNGLVDLAVAAVLIAHVGVMAVARPERADGLLTAVGVHLVPHRGVPVHDIGDIGQGTFPFLNETGRAPDAPSASSDGDAWKPPDAHSRHHGCRLLGR